MLSRDMPILALTRFILRSLPERIETCVTVTRPILYAPERTVSILFGIAGLLEGPQFVFGLYLAVPVIVVAMLNSPFSVFVGGLLTVLLLSPVSAAWFMISIWRYRRTQWFRSTSDFLLSGLVSGTALVFPFGLLGMIFLTFPFYCTSGC